MKDNGEKKFMGAHTSEKFHRTIRVRCIEESLTIREAVLVGLSVLLGVDLPDEILDFYEENGYPAILLDDIWRKGGSYATTTNEAGKSEPN